MEKFCQSCGMPINEFKEGSLGTESDGSFSNKFCSYCYKDGQFTEPNITFEEMKALGLKGISEGGGNALARGILKLFYPIQLKKLERWKK